MRVHNVSPFCTPFFFYRFYWFSISERLLICTPKRNALERCSNRYTHSQVHALIFSRVVKSVNKFPSYLFRRATPIALQNQFRQFSHKQMAHLTQIDRHFLVVTSISMSTAHSPAQHIDWAWIGSAWIWRTTLKFDAVNAYRWYRARRRPWKSVSLWLIEIITTWKQQQKQRCDVDVCVCVPAIGRAVFLFIHMREHCSTIFGPNLFFLNNYSLVAV